MPNVGPNEFDEELQAFENDVDVAIQCFYTWLTVDATARKSRKVYDMLNRNAGFWVLAMDSIHANSLIALGRIFDTDKRTHNVRRLLNLTEANISLFSKDSVRLRKKKVLANASHLEFFMSDVQDPRSSDLKRLRSFVDRRREVYERCYKQLRDKRYAHRERTDISVLAEKANTQELGRLISDLHLLHGVLWHWLRNGRPPRLIPRHSLLANR